MRQEQRQGKACVVRLKSTSCHSCVPSTVSNKSSRTKTALWRLAAGIPLSGHGLRGSARSSPQPQRGSLLEQGASDPRVLIQRIAWGCGL